MDYDFGDIIDCRDAPINHFILILGENQNNEIMYYKVTSRTYKVFKDMLAFANDCIDKGNDRFFHFFKEDKTKKRIYPIGNLCDAFFLDKHTNYQGHLDVDSMVLINSEPRLDDKVTINRWISSKKAKYCTRLEKNDAEKLIKAIRLTKNIGGTNKSEIGRNYNLWKKSKLKKQ